MRFSIFTDGPDWMYGTSHLSDEYLSGVEEFMKCATEDMKNNEKDKMVCPCCDCNNLRNFSMLDQVRGHLIRRGFKQQYTCWIWHGENVETDTCNDTERDEDHNIDNDESDHVEVDGNDDDFDQMLRDLEEDFVNDKQYCMFENLKDDSEKPLFPDCTKFTKLSAVLKLFNLKASSGWSDKSFSALLELLREMLPDGN